MFALSRQNATLAAALLLFCAKAAAAQVIVGRVVDDSSGAAVPGARVSAAGLERNGSTRTLAREDGRFALTLRGGRYRVQAARTGYGAQSEVVTVGPGDTARITLRLSSTALPLKALTATARQRRPPLRGIYIPVVPNDTLLSLPIRVHGGARKITIFGQMATPTPCYRLRGAADRRGQAIDLAIQARPTGEECAPGAIGASTYEVVVHRLPAGTYTLRVIHAFGDGAWPPRVVTDTAVVVQ